MDEFCRCCAKKDVLLEDIFKNDKNNSSGLNAVQMLRIFIRFNIEEEALMPKNICYQCLNDLKAAYNFHSKLISTQRILCNSLHQSNSKHLRKILPKYDNTLYRCTACDLHFKSDSNLKHHCRIHHSKASRLYTCQECMVKFKSNKLLSAHIKSHVEENVCWYCNTFFLDKDSCKIHAEEVHGDKKFFCSQCSMKLQTRNRFVLHTKEKHGTFLIYCNECQEIDSFKTKDDLKSHILAKHESYYSLQTTTDKTTEEYLDMDEEFLDDIFLNQDENFDFYSCWNDISLTFELDFKDKEQNNTNIDKTIPSPIRYTCPKCNEGFEKQLPMFFHLAHDHGVKSLVCNICGLAFSRIENHKAHRNAHLQGNVSKTLSCHETNIEEIKCSAEDKKQVDFGFQCTLCSSKFPTRRLMYSHRRMTHFKHGFTCTTCGKSFKSMLGLNYHIKTHTGLKPYICPYCPQKFIANVNLYSHICTSHAEMKPHDCKLCDRKFGTTDHLRKHVTSVHQKERNYLCSTCGKKFAQSCHLKQHMRLHNNIQATEIT